MTDPKPSFSPARKWSVSLSVVVSTIAVFALMLMLNYLAARHYYRFPLALNTQTEISPLTLRVPLGLVLRWAAMEVELVTRAGCHLCEDALGLLRELGVEPRQRDVDADAELFRHYDWRVPVVLVDGRPVGEGKIDAASLRRALRL